MNEIYLTPYSIVENEVYPNTTKIVIRVSDFMGVPYEDGKITFSFINCRFEYLEIENKETIDFNNISIQFNSCFIAEISVETFITTNFSLFFGSSILQGRIRNSNLQSVTVNNCLLNQSLFLLNLNHAVVSYTEENIFPSTWKKLLKSVGADFITYLKPKQSYVIYDTKNVVFSFNENSTETRGIYKRVYSTDIEKKVGYYFSDEEKKNVNISLSLYYSADMPHKLTKIKNAKLSNLAISGYSTGELIIESAKIDNLFIHDFTSELGSSLYNIRPFRKESLDLKFEIRKSNLDKFWFEDVAFNDFSIISFYRNKFGQTSIISCEFPNSYKGFDKFKTVENIHYPDKLGDNYQKTRYETFLQLKKILEASGNFYESQKLQTVSNEALRKIDDIPFWDRVILNINSLSNNHGLSIKEPFCATIILSVFFYILYLSTLNRIFNSNNFDFDLIGYYFAFLDITHRSDFLVSKSELNGFSLTIDYIGKIVVSFFIYQFIAAFRKYGKK
jgi:hypothetical protein